MCNYVAYKGFYKLCFFYIYFYKRRFLHLSEVKTETDSNDTVEIQTEVAMLQTSVYCGQDFTSSNFLFVVINRNTVFAENLELPHRELLVWAVVFGHMSLAMIFWKECPDQLGSALVSSLICKSLARKAKTQQMADKPVSDAG